MVIEKIARFLPSQDTAIGNKKLALKLPIAIPDKRLPAARKLIPASAIMDGNMAPITRTAIPLTA
jgi:hypothetical protein